MINIVDSFQVLFGAAQRGGATKWECLQELWPWRCIRLQEHRQWRGEVEQGWYTLFCLWHFRPLWPRHEGEDHYCRWKCTFFSSIGIVVIFWCFSCFNFPAFHYFIRCACCVICNRCSAFCVLNFVWGYLPYWVYLLPPWTYHFIWILEINYSQCWVCDSNSELDIFGFCFVVIEIWRKSRIKVVGIAMYNPGLIFVQYHESTLISSWILPTNFSSIDCRKITYLYGFNSILHISDLNPP